MHTTTHLFNTRKTIVTRTAASASAQFIDNPIVINARIQRELDKVVAGSDKITFQSPVPQANLEGQVELLADTVYYSVAWCMDSVLHV